MLKSLYRKISFSKLIPLNKNLLDESTASILEAGFKKISPPSYNKIAVFTSESELSEATDIVVLNLNIYSIFSKDYTLDEYSIKILSSLFRILAKEDREVLKPIAFIICTNPFTLTEYFEREKIRLDRNTRVLHIAPTSLYFSLYQKNITYLILEYNSRFVNKHAYDKIFREIVNTNILLNKSNNYLTDYVIKEGFYDVFTIGGPLLKAYTLKEGDDSFKTPILVSLETPPFIDSQQIIRDLRESLNKIDVTVKDFLEFSSVHIKPFNSLHIILEKAYTEIIGEQPYIDWFTIPSTVEVFNKFFKTVNQLIFGPGVLTKPDGGVFRQQLSIFLKIFNNFLKIKGGGLNEGEQGY